MDVNSAHNKVHIDLSLSATVAGHPGIGSPSVLPGCSSYQWRCEGGKSQSQSPKQASGFGCWRECVTGIYRKVTRFPSERDGEGSEIKLVRYELTHTTNSCSSGPRASSSIARTMLSSVAMLSRGVGRRGSLCKGHLLPGHTDRGGHAGRRGGREGGEERGRINKCHLFVHFHN